jgi:CheY-like chemotaxis protein
MATGSSIVVVGGDPDENRRLCGLLEDHGYRTISLQSLDELAQRVAVGPCDAIVVDLDSLPVGNRFLRRIRKEYPDLCVIAVSGRTFHPELEEAMRTCISVCLQKPVDEDELLYWLKSIAAGTASPRASPPGKNTT